MTRVEEEKVTTTYEEVDPPTQHVDNINLNVNTKDGESVVIEETPDETPDETRTTQTTTTRSEVRQGE
jgi:hypothetical protein